MAIETVNMDTETGGVWLNPVTGFQRITGKEAIRQRIITGIKTFKGEWFLNINYGLDYIGVIFNRKAPLDLVNSAVRARIMSTPGVVGLNGYFASIEKSTRTLKVFIKQVVTDDGIINNLSLTLGV